MIVWGGVADAFGGYDDIEGGRYDPTTDTWTPVSLTSGAVLDGRIAQMRFPGGEPMVDYRGFVSGAGKEEVFRESDCFCFPTYYAAESFGLALVEAMASAICPGERRSTRPG